MFGALVARETVFPLATAFPPRRGAAGESRAERQIRGANRHRRRHARGFLGPLQTHQAADFTNRKISVPDMMRVVPTHISGQ